MAKTVVGLFEDRNEAQRVVDDLTKNGFSRSEITTSEGDTSNVTTILSDAQIPDQDVRFYNQGVQQGDTLIAVQTSDDKARHAADIMSRYNTVHRTDVDVEQLGTQQTGRTTSTGTSANAGATPTSGSFDDTYYRDYYNSNLTNSGYTYDQYSPVFRYGEALGTSERYRGKNWLDVEPEARREWESRNKGTWDEFKDSIRHAWHRATGKQ